MRGSPKGIIVNGILAAAGLPAVTQTVSPRLAHAAALAYEGVYRLFGIQSEPRLTRFLVKQLSTAHWFNISAARRDLGYKPKFSIEQGMAKLKAYLNGPDDVLEAPVHP